MEREPAVWKSALTAAALGLVIGIRHAGELLAVAAARVGALAGLPRSRATDWVEALRPAVVALEQWDPLLELAALLLAAWLLVQLARVLNPRGRLRLETGTGFAGPWYTAPLDGSVATRCALAVAVCIYLFGGFRWAWQAGTSFFPAPIAWGLTGLLFRIPRGPLTGLLLAFLAGGAVLWLLWGERGVLSRTVRRATVPAQDAQSSTLVAERPSSPDGSGFSEEPESTSLVVPHPPAAGFAQIAARGALAGLIALPLLLPLTEVGRSVLRELVGALSVTNARPWRLLAIAELAWVPLALVLLVGVTRALGQPGIAPTGRIALLLAPVAFAAAAALGEKLFYQRVAVDRYALGVPLGRELPDLKPIAEGRAYLLLGPDGGGYSGVVPYGSIQGFAAGRDLQQPVWGYLSRRHSETPETGRLFVHLYDSAAVDWDSPELLHVCLAEMESNPERIFAQLLLEKLSACQITPENRTALDALADPARFRFEGPAAASAMAQLRHRFGEPDKTERAALTNGIVTGTVLISGRPLPGLRIGLVPATQASTLPGRPRPFEHRLIAAATTADAAGAFRIDHIGEGEYLLIVMAKERDLPLRRPTVSVTHSPRIIHLDASSPVRDLGTVDVLLQSLPPADPAAPHQPASQSD